MANLFKTVYILQCFDSDLDDVHLIGEPMATKEEALKAMTEDIQHNAKEEALEYIFKNQADNHTAQIYAEQSEKGCSVFYRISRITI